MKIDLNSIARCIEDMGICMDIDKSQYLTEQVLCTIAFYTEIYAIPVDVKRITDPLFYREAYFVGKIVAVQLGQDLPNVFRTKDDEHLGKCEIKDRIGNKCMAKLSPKNIYTDGIHVYGIYHDGICHDYLLELEEMLLYYPASIKIDAYRVFRFGFIESDNRMDIYEREIKPNMQPKDILPLIKHQQSDIVHEYQTELDDLENKLCELRQKRDSAYRILCNLRPEEVENIQSAMADPFKELLSHLNI